MCKVSTKAEEGRKQSDLKAMRSSLLKMLVRVKRWIREDGCASRSSTWRMREWPQSKALDEGEDEVKKGERDSVKSGF